MVKSVKDSSSTSSGPAQIDLFFSAVERNGSERNGSLPHFSKELDSKTLDRAGHN